jgi:hypothetical protein
MHVQCIGIQYVQQKFGFCYFFIYVVKSIAFKALQWSHTHWCGCIPFSIILLSTFAKQINDTVVRNLRRVSHVNLLLNFKNKQTVVAVSWNIFLVYEKVSKFNYCILAIFQLLHTCKPYHAPIHKTSKNKQKTEYMIVGSRQWLCNIIDDRKKRKRL